MQTLLWFFFTIKKIAIIDLKNNVYIFPTLITRVKTFHFKNNLNAIIINARNVEEKFENIIIVINVNILRNRATSIKKKVLILNK